jgi:hypothetical protein
VEDPRLRRARVRTKSGEKTLLQVRVEGRDASTGEPQWRLNDELVAIGTSWTYKAGPGRRVDLVTVSLPGAAASPGTFLAWHFSVE